MTTRPRAIRTLLPTSLIRDAARFVRVVVVFGLFVAVAVSAGADPADAAPTSCVGTVIDGDCYVEVNSGSYVACANGYSPAGGVCRVVGDLSGVFVCPSGPAGTTVTVNHVTINATEYIETCTYPRIMNCAPGTTSFDGRCWERSDVGPGPATTPVAENGSVSLAYTIACAGEGVARVALGTPALEDGAAVSLITVNGSAAVAADLPGGSPVVVVVTPVRAGDSVSVTGPSVAPLCQTDEPEPTAAPTAAPAARPASSTPQPAAPSQAPAPTPTTEAVTPEATVTVAQGATATPLPQATPSAPVSVPSATPVAASASTASLECAPNQAFVTGRCLSPCPSSEAAGAETAAQVCFAVEVSSPRTTAETAAVVSPSAPAAANNAMVLLLAALGGVLLAALALVGGAALARPKQQSTEDVSLGAAVQTF